MKIHPYYPAQLVPVNAVLLNPNGTLENFEENDTVSNVYIIGDNKSVEVCTHNGLRYVFPYDMTVYCQPIEILMPLFLDSPDNMTKEGFAKLRADWSHKTFVIDSEAYHIQEKILKHLKNSPWFWNDVLNCVMSESDVVSQVQKQREVFSKSPEELFSIVFNTFVSNFKSKRSNQINVEFNVDGGFKISDNSKNIPSHYFSNMIKEHAVSSNLHFGVDDENAINIPDSGLHKLFIVSALSKHFKIRYSELNSTFNAEMKDGYFISGLSSDSKNCFSSETGLNISFQPNYSLFNKDKDSFNYDKTFQIVIMAKLLNPELKIKVKNILGEEIDLLSEDAMSDLFDFNYPEYSFKSRDDLIANTTTINKDNVRVSVLFKDTKDGKPFECVSFINDHKTENGGSHEFGLITALKKLSSKLNIDENLIGCKSIIAIDSPQCILSEDFTKVNDLQLAHKIIDMIMENN